MKTTNQLVGLLFAAAVLITGCSREDKQARTGSVPGTCNYTAAKVYTGAVAAGDGPQAVTVEAQVVSRPMDRLDVILCRNADCAVAVPATWCSDVPLAQLATTPCKVSTPSVMVAYSDGAVSIRHAGTPGYSDQAHRDANIADIPGYTSYVIAEQLCQ